MSDEDRKKNAFSTSKGLFHFKRLLFGLVNAGATYCRMMRKLLSDIDCVNRFVDDILVHTSTWKEHLVILPSTFPYNQIFRLNRETFKVLRGRKFSRFHR